MQLMQIALIAPLHQLKERRPIMAKSRNTPVFDRIVQALTYSFPTRQIALQLLEDRFENELIVSAGNINTVEAAAKALRLDINQEECAQVLDYIAEHLMVVITIEHVETAAYALFGNRFIEPEN
jgi:hypothetical protein